MVERFMSAVIMKEILKHPKLMANNSICNVFSLMITESSPGSYIIDKCYDVKNNSVIRYKPSQREPDSRVPRDFCLEDYKR